MGVGLRSGALAAGLIAVGAVVAGPASADTVNFPYVAPTEQTPNPYAEWTVPIGVTQATFDLFGAQGAGASQRGGRGAHVTTTMAVTPGVTYRIYVGGQGAGDENGSTPEAGTGAGGYNGGGKSRTGGGGGATDVRTAPGASSDRVLVAGGGGGRETNSDLETSGNGGDSDADGQDAFVFGANDSPARGGKSGSNGGAGGAGFSGIAPGGASGTCQTGGSGSASQGGDATGPGCPDGGGGGGGLLGGGAGGGGVFGGGAGGGGGSNKVGSGTVVNGDHSGDGQASVTYTVSTGVVTVDGPLTPFQADGSARFKAGTVLEIRVKPRRDGQLITGLSPKVNIVRTGAPSGPQTATVPFNSQAATAGTTMRYSAQFGQYQFYAATKKSQFNAGKDLATGRYRVDVSDPVFPTPANKVSRAFSLVP